MVLLFYKKEKDMTKIIFVDMVGDELMQDDWKNTSTRAIQEFCVEQDWILEDIADHEDGVVKVVVDNS